MIVIIDNKDSFTYNLIDYIKTETALPLQVYEVDDVSLEKLSQLQVDALVISPGPGKPSDYPILKEVMQHYEGEIPILGVCLGFQFIYEYYGGHIIHGTKPIHGHTTRLNHSGTGIFKDLPQRFEVMRYHSLMADKNTLLLS